MYSIHSCVRFWFQLLWQDYDLKDAEMTRMMNQIEERLKKWISNFHKSAANICSWIKQFNYNYSLFEYKYSYIVQATFILCVGLQDYIGIKKNSEPADFVVQIEWSLYFKYLHIAKSHNVFYRLGLKISCINSGLTFVSKHYDFCLCPGSLFRAFTFGLHYNDINNISVTKKIGLFELKIFFNCFLQHCL